MRSSLFLTFTFFLQEAGADDDAPPLVVVVASCEPIATGDDDVGE